MLISANEVATISSPVVTTRLLPNRRTHTLLNGAASMIVPACGNSTAPAFTVEYPSTSCRYCVIRNSVPKSAKKVMVMAPLAALNRGFSKKCRSSIGCGVRISHARKAASKTRPTAKASRMTLSVHPCDGASITPQSNAVIAAIDSSAPMGSSRDCAGSFDSGTNTYPSTRPMTTIGTLTRKIEPHQK